MVNHKKILFPAERLSKEKLLLLAPELSHSLDTNTYEKLSDRDGYLSKGSVAILERILEQKRNRPEKKMYNYRELIVAARIKHGVGSNFERIKALFELVDNDSHMDCNDDLSIKESIVQYFIRTRSPVMLSMNNDEDFIKKSFWIQNYSSEIAILSSLFNNTETDIYPKNKGFYEAVIATMNMKILNAPPTQLLVRKFVYGEQGIRISNDTADKAILFINMNTPERKLY